MIDGSRLERPPPQITEEIVESMELEVRRSDKVDADWLRVAHAGDRVTLGYIKEFTNEHLLGRNFLVLNSSLFGVFFALDLVNLMWRRPNMDLFVRKRGKDAVHQLQIVYKVVMAVVIGGISVPKI